MIIEAYISKVQNVYSPPLIMQPIK